MKTDFQKLLGMIANMPSDQRPEIETKQGEINGREFKKIKTDNIVFGFDVEDESLQFICNIQQ